MSKLNRDEAREERIMMEAVVDAYDEDEQAMGWYHYLEDKINFPFAAICINKRSTSPIAEGSKVAVVGMAAADECLLEMLVEIEWEGNILTIPLSQIQAIDVDPNTLEAIEDWHYWVDCDYQFG